MKYRVVELLQSVPDLSPLRVDSIRETKALPIATGIDTVRCEKYCARRDLPVAAAGLTATDCRECYSIEIVEGELASASGKKYPIAGGIPRILSPEAMTFIQKNRQSF